ncbi:MAG: hypothetical protein OEZ58_14305 [Gammaproteobacteria bacterium]|nr:hypothetical protein [Gammaproteobacteria bacterium]MDH5730164.1 hypothetical protein [Gammaproteobacteria bacterium]
MSERAFRLVQGIYIFIALILEIDQMLYVLIGILLFEAITNWRVPVLVNKILYAKNQQLNSSISDSCKIAIDAERLQSLGTALFLIFTFILYPVEAWIGPWFIAALMLMAGVTNICPMVIFLRWLGFR